MNAENFADFIQSRSRLFHLPYEELKSLVLQYPYSQNLHLLLLTKSWLEQHPEAGQNLAKAALYSSDRAVLYRHVQELIAEVSYPEENFLFGEDFLELKELPGLADFEQLPDLTLPKEAAVPMPAPPLLFPEEKPHVPGEIAEEADLSIFDLDAETEEAPAAPLLNSPETSPERETGQESNPASSKLLQPEPVESIPPVSPLPTEPHLPAEPEPDILTEWLGVTEKLEGQLSQKLLHQPDVPAKEAESSDQTPEPTTGISPSPLPRTTFTSWQQQYQQSYIQQRLQDLRKALQLPDQSVAEDTTEQSGPPAEPEQEPDVLWFARKSVQDNDDLASETLAEILVHQQQYARAIAVYERLILLFPEKSL